MRPSLELESAPFTSGLPSGEKDVSSSWAVPWAVLIQFAEEMWVEVLIVLLVLYIYLLTSKRGTFGGNAQKVADGGRPLQTSASKKGFAGAGPKVTSNFRKYDLKDGESQRVQKLVISLLQKTHKTNPSALLNEYAELVKACGSNLRGHLSDDQNARSMYLGLIGCAVGLPGAATEKSMEAPGVAVQRWTSQLLVDMRALGFPRSVEFYAAALKMFAANELPREGLWLHEAMRDDGLVPNSVMLISLLNMAVACGESTKALSFFEGIAESTPPSLRTIMTVLRVHSANQDWQGACKLLDRMESLGTPPDNLIVNSVLGLCISVGAIDGAEQLLQRWRHITDVISCNILLKGCAQQGNLTRAEALLNGMVTNGPEPNLISYNTVMDCAVRNMQMLNADRPQQGGRNAATADSGPSHSFVAIARRPWDLLDQLTSRGLEPDRYTCSTLVKGMHLAGCSVSDIDRAVDLLNRIGSTALQAPSVGSGGSMGSNARLLEVLFNTLLDACITVRDLDRMAQIFAMMQQFNVSVSAVTYGTLVKAFGQAGRLNRCHEVWEDMRRAGINPTIVTYGCYIDSCIRNNDNDRAEEIFESMMATPHGVRPNAVIYTSLIRGFANTKQPRKALEFYRRMQQEGIEATSVTFNSVLDVVARQLSEPSVLQEVIDDMCKANIVPDVVTYSILMKASCSAGNVNTALSLFRQIQSRGLVFDQVAFNTLLLACSKAEQIADAEEIFEEMRRVGVAPSHVTTSIMVKMYGRAKMLDKAVALTDLLLKEYGQEPNLYVYTCLIQACVQNKQVRRSWEVFNRMVNSGVAPDAVTYGTVIHGCIYLNKFSYAMSLVRHAYGRPLLDCGDQDTPFVATAPLKHAVTLQPEVLQTLLAAMQRKEQHSLVVELEDIMAQNVAVPNESNRSHGGKYGRRGR